MKTLALALIAFGILLAGCGAPSESPAPATNATPNAADLNGSQRLGAPGMPSGTSR